MEERIIKNINNFEQLERLYRSDKRGFEKAFFKVYPEIAGHKTAQIWKIRLEFEVTKEEPVSIRKKDLFFLILSCAIAGFLIEIPQLFGSGLKESLFYEKNVGLIVFLGLSLYFFLTKGTVKTKHLLFTSIVFIISAIYINLLPSNKESDSIFLAFIHLPLLLWCLYGLVFIDFNTSDKLKRIDYLKYNGDLAILMALLFIAGGILTGVTVGLFAAIDLNIEQFYFDYIVLVGLVSAPILGTFIIRKFPYITHKIAPIIANIFSPIVLLTLVVYLISILITGKDPYNDRDFLLAFNLMLLGVMAIIVFSISETSISKKQRFTEITLLALVMVTVFTDLVALSAILYRLGEYGFTPNRTAVLGSNLLILVNLFLIMFDLYRVNFKNKEIEKVELTIAKYLPVYMLWTIFVVFVLPALFGLK